ncbi:MAG: hypothetical protein E4G96_10800 [Chrysiogenales bacterium]|nr:MAG: hypothetical protein E4G96_10800 [Chrysiogenales bacterium]
MGEKEFFPIPAGVYRIGTDNPVIEALHARIESGVVKKEYLCASCPSHDILIDTVSFSERLVTRSEFAEFVADTGYTTESERMGWGWISDEGRWQKRGGVSWRAPFGLAADDRCVSEGVMPVMQVSWNDAVAYCEWLTRRAGVVARLPREGEWEVFAKMCGVTGMDELYDAAVGVPAPGHFTDRLLDYFGTRSGIGFLWEWTEDWYEGYPGGESNSDYGRVYRVLRGGSILSLPFQRTREYRIRKCPTARSPYYGFRIALYPGAA